MSNEKVFKTTVIVSGKGSNAKRKTIRANSKKDLDRLVREFYNDRDKGKQVGKRALLSTWADKWYNDNEISERVSSGMDYVYKNDINILKYYFGNYELKDIKLSDFNSFLREVAITKYYFDKEGNFISSEPREQMLSKRTLKAMISTAKQIFEYAIANDIPATNFFSCVKIPMGATYNPRRALTEFEQQMIIDTPHRCQLSAMIMLFSGLRRGELLALTWQDIDLQNATIRVNKSLDIKTGEIKDGGKTRNATRTVPMLPILVDYLSAYKESLKVINVNGLVCTDAKGRKFTETGFRRMWESYLTDLNVKYGYANKNVSKYDPKGLPMKIEPFTAHYLRHTFATILYLQQIPPQVAMQYMGHADYQTTLNIYTDVAQYNFATLSDAYKSKLENEYKIA